MHRSERVERRGHGARASEFAQGLLRVGRPDQDGRPALAHGQPTIEQLAERAVTRSHSPQEPEQGALARIDAQPEIEPAAERIEVDEDARPALAGERRQRGSTLARPRRSFAPDYGENAPRP